MPTKKKRKMDPMVLRQRQERRKKRLTKALRKMDKRPRIPKPILELEVDPAVFGGEMFYKRKRAPLSDILSPQEVENKTEESALLAKEWCRFAGRRHMSEICQIDAVIISRRKALEELRKESNELYIEAIKPDVTFHDQQGQLLYQAVGPTATPPIRASTTEDSSEDHLVDGHYEDATKKYQVQYADTGAFMTKLLSKTNRRRKSNKDDADE